MHTFGGNIHFIWNIICIVIGAFPFAENGYRRSGNSEGTCLPMILGNASYPTYLFHGPMLLVVGSFIKAIR